MKAAPSLTVIPSIDVADDVIEKLEQALERARNGELSMVAVALVYRDGSSGSCRSHCHNTATLLGSIELLKARIIAPMLE